MAKIRAGLLNVLNVKYLPRQCVSWSAYVCFINPTADGKAEKNLQSIIKREFDKTSLRFSGWEKCIKRNIPFIDIYKDRAIRIKWSNEEWPIMPHPNAFSISSPAHGTLPYDLANLNILGFDQCGPKNSATHQKCLELIYIHEFGHGIGLGHENLRPERSNASNCHVYDENKTAPNFENSNSFNIRLINKKIGSFTEGAIGEYDEQSIMNKCFYRNETYTEESVVALSSGDIETINFLYDKNNKSSSTFDCSDTNIKNSEYLKLDPNSNLCEIIKYHQNGCPGSASFDRTKNYCLDVIKLTCVNTEAFPCPVGTTEEEIKALDVER